MRNARKFLMFTSCLMISTWAWGRAERQVSVTGDCTRPVVPDRGSVTLVSESLEPNPGTATQKAMDHYEKIRQRVKSLNLKNMELETTEFSVNEDLEWTNNTRKSRGFRARMGLKVITSETARLGDVALLASELKVREVSGLQTFVSRETLRSERENCLEEALKNARNKAEKLAKTAGARLGPVMQIQEDLLPSETPGPRPMAKMMMADSVAARQSPGVEAGVSQISVGIQAVFELQ